MEELALEFLKIIIANKADKFEVSEHVYLAYNYAKEFTRQTEMQRHIAKYDPNYYQRRPLMAYKASIYGDGSVRELSFAEEIDRERYITQHYEDWTFVTEVDDVNTVLWLGDFIPHLKGRLHVSFYVFKTEEEALEYIDSSIV